MPSPTTFSAWGALLGGSCASGQLGSGVCLCDNLARGRFAFPSAASSQPGGKYDYFFQGWAGPDCSIPCLPCSANGQCDLTTGECVCYSGWGGYRCLSPCEPCSAAGGTCQPDGSCLCLGARRLREGSYALRLARDPFFLEKGHHVYQPVGGGPVWSEYVHPVYNSSATVEDYLWEIEFQCLLWPECAGRTPDSHQPTRPNETYFRYGPPVSNQRLIALAAVEALDAEIAYQRYLIEGVPFTMNGSVVCMRPGTPGLAQTVDACIADMQQRLWGRTNSSCGGQPADSTRPADCDSVLKVRWRRILSFGMTLGLPRKLGKQQQHKHELTTPSPPCSPAPTI